MCIVPKEGNRFPSDFLTSVKTSGGLEVNRQVWWFRQTIGACITQPRGLPASAESWHPFQGSDDNFQARACSRILGLQGAREAACCNPHLRAEHEHRIAKNPRETASLCSWNHFWNSSSRCNYSLLVPPLLPLPISHFPSGPHQCVLPSCNSLGNPVIPFATAMTRVHVCFNVV